VPDLTTTVLTMTITGVAADSRAAGGQGSKAGRRLIAIGAMLAGAVVGATLVIHAPIVYPLAIALGVTVVAAATSLMLARSGWRLASRAVSLRSLDQGQEVCHAGGQ
jgi:hypothetical protein